MPAVSIQLGLLADDLRQSGRAHRRGYPDFVRARRRVRASILQCILQLITFLQRAVGAVRRAADPDRLRRVLLPGYMVWAAVLYALFGSILTLRPGSGLIRRAMCGQGREADVRSVLIRAQECRGYRLDARRTRRTGAAAPPWRIWGSLAHPDARARQFRPAHQLARLHRTRRSADFGVAALPFGDIQLGGLMQTAQAFSNVQWALSWVIDNFPRFADWRASTDRVVHLHAALLDLEGEHRSPDGERIEVTPGRPDRLILREVGLSRPDGEALVAEAEVEIQPGERVLIAASRAAARAPSCAPSPASGRGAAAPSSCPRPARLHAAEAVFSARHPARRSSIPSAGGSPRRGPARGVAQSGASIICAAGSARPSAGTTSCPAASSKAVAFARVLIQKPAWVFMDEATSALDEAGQANIMHCWPRNCPGPSVVSIGHRPGLEEFHTRELVLEPGNRARSLGRRSGAEPARPLPPHGGDQSGRDIGASGILVELAEQAALGRMTGGGESDDE